MTIQEGAHEAPALSAQAEADAILRDNLVQAYAAKVCRFSLMNLCPLHLRRAEEQVDQFLEVAEDLGYYLVKRRFAEGETLEHFFEAAGVEKVEHADQQG